MRFLYLGLIFLTWTLSSCKKEPLNDPEIADHSHYEGTYYGIQTTEANQFVAESESDCILPTTVDGDQLSFNGASFIIPSSQPTSFSVGDWYYSGANLNFSSDHTLINFERRFDGGITTVDVTFNGEKTNLPLTNDTEHPLKAQLEGTFILQIEKHEYLSGIDESYLDTVVVTMSGFNPVIDNEEFSAGMFYTYFKLNSLWDDGLDCRDLYWTEDSLYLNYQYIPHQGAGITDTIHHVYSGRKL